jgi:hypothetical protein
MPDYSLVPVDYQPDFDDYSPVPVDHDPFAADGVTQQAQIQQAQAQPQGPPQQQPATGAGQPDAGAPAAGGGPSGSEGGGIGPTGGAPNPTLDQGAAKAAPFGGYSLVPVDYQPDFDDFSLVPVDYDPLAADGLAQQAQIQQPPTPTQPAQPQTQPQQPATGAGQPGVNGPATGNSPSGSGGGAGVKRFGGAEGGDFPSRNAGIGFESADRAWYAALKEMRDLGAQHYPEEAKSRGFIPELGVEIYKRGGLYYYDQIARGFQDGALGGGVGFGDSGAVARGHMHWDNQLRSDGDRDNARVYSQAVPGYQAWVGSWDGFKLYWYNGKEVPSGMPDWNRYKY